MVAVKRIGQAIHRAATPTAGLVPGLVSDLTRSRRELLTESWATFLRNQASQIWACDFLQTYGSS